MKIIVTNNKIKMQRNQLAAMLLLLTGIAFFACKKDLGNYDYQDANKIGIVAAADSFAVRQNDTLAIDITLNQSIPSSDLSYQWLLIQATASNPNPSQYQLDSVEDLRVKILVVPGLYKVVSKITDKKTGVSFYKYFSLKVLPAPWAEEGWLVLQDQSGISNGNDFSVILSRDGATHGAVYHNLYQQANGRKLPIGTNYMNVINHIFSLGIQKVMFAYEGGATEVKAIDFSDSSYANGWFFTPPQKIDIQFNGAVDGAQRELLINNGQLHYRAVNAFTVRTAPILFGAPVLGTWTLSPFVLQSATSSDHYATYYDKANRCFLTFNSETNALVPVRPDIANAHYPAYSGPASALTNTGSGFDLNNIGKDLIYAENAQQVPASSSSSLAWNCFFRSTGGDSSFVYQLPVYLFYTNNMTTGRHYLDPVRCPEINSATLFACPTFLTMPGSFYYASQNQVFTCTLSPQQGRSTAVVGYSFPAGTEIKAMRVFKSGYSGPTTLPRTPYPATEGKVLVVATDETASGNGHNVYFFNINNNGSLPATFADKYTGFNKIIDIRFKKGLGL
jgi:hypothetical protein